MPFTVGKWWGNIQDEGKRKESEIDVVAFDDNHLVIDECIYRNKGVGLQELNPYRQKGCSFNPKAGNSIICWQAKVVLRRNSVPWWIHMSY